MMVVLTLMKVADSMFLSTSTTAWFEAVCKAFYCCLTTLTPHNLCEAGGTNTSEALPYPQPYPDRARACALRALGLLLADGAPTVGGGKTF